MISTAEKIFRAGHRQALFRARDIEDAVDPRSTLRRLTALGELVRMGRGLYALPHGEITEHHALVEASMVYPGSVVCLISALVFHGIGTQVPHETWLMRQDRRCPPPPDSRVRFVYCSSGNFTFGIETHTLDGTSVSIYSPARTVADCFKYRNKLGLDIALEALKEGWHDRHFTMDELWAASSACRVQRVIRPYLEMLAA